MVFSRASRNDFRETSAKLDLPARCDQRSPAILRLVVRLGNHPEGPSMRKTEALLAEASVFLLLAERILGCDFGRALECWTFGVDDIPHQWHLHVRDCIARRNWVVDIEVATGFPGVGV